MATRREIQNKKWREWARKNPDKIRAYRKKWWANADEEERKRRNEVNRKWRLKNKDKLAASQKKFRAAHPERYKAFRAKYRQRPSYIANVIRRSAKARGLECSFNSKEFVEWYDKQEKTCYYCGVTAKDMPDSFRCYKHQKNKRLTIDRMDNNKGYSLENIVLACVRCNAIKSDFFSGDEMRKIGQQFVRPKWEKEVKNG